MVIQDCQTEGNRPSLPQCAIRIRNNTRAAETAKKNGEILGVNVIIIIQPGIPARRVILRQTGTRVAGLEMPEVRLINVLVLIEVRLEQPDIRL